MSAVSEEVRWTEEAPGPARPGVGVGGGEGRFVGGPNEEAAE